MTEASLLPEIAEEAQARPPVEGVLGGRGQVRLAALARVFGRGHAKLTCMDGRRAARVLVLRKEARAEAQEQTSRAEVECVGRFNQSAVCDFTHLVALLQTETRLRCA